ncbi:Nucleotide-binding protein, UspA family [Halanaeroarchaeum sp. HSR-CO]|uniref:universal stress protein n=1 Tax=Halanaeroarchaeum sp. HSR-CO TaxID=2866382 RepID=UPI00217D1865|nr:universal stress protein [Halanaeroarchaeum sp. HSR-CO]UWG48529.1 Nucleotide-binding protein, UspA family [Halanaeroarchaeum sp. HSR-CO]
MGLYDRILVPTDGSDATERAVVEAVDLAAAHDATIHALYVVNTASFASIPTESSVEGVSEMLEREGDAALDAVEGAANERGVPVERVQLDGSPAREIVRYAEQSNCDLVVMGTHGRGGIDRLLLGSVAERVVRSSTVPVLTVRVDEE